MASNPVSPNWQWPKEFGEKPGVVLEVEQLRKDRDELAAALARALEREADEHRLSDIEREESAEDHATLARIRG